MRVVVYINNKVCFILMDIGFYIWVIINYLYLVIIFKSIKL